MGGRGLSRPNFMKNPRHFHATISELRRPKQVSVYRSTLSGFVPNMMGPHSTDLGGGVLWGATAFTGALFVVQNFLMGAIVDIWEPFKISLVPFCQRAPMALRLSFLL